MRSLWKSERLQRERGSGSFFDPRIHLAFMVWRRQRSPLNLAFRWREGGWDKEREREKERGD